MTFTFSGTNSPALSAGEIGPIFVPNDPNLRISSIAGQAVSAEPTGIQDVTFPEDLVQPVSVGIAASQVPLGTIVTVLVKAQNGDVVEYISNALDGTLEASTATVEGVTLPSGPSVLEAQASFTLVLAAGGGESASMQGTPLLYQGERIEMAEERTASNGETEVFYMTSSKKRIPEDEIGPLDYALSRSRRDRPSTNP